MHSDGGVSVESQRNCQPGSVKDFQFAYVGHDTPADSLLAICGLLLASRIVRPFYMLRS